MDYAAICLAILLWLIRPQDWMTGLAGVGFMKYAMLAALLGLFTRSPERRVSFRLSSPADYFVIGYLTWIIYTTGDYFDTFKEVLPFAVFYFVTAYALDTPRRLAVFLQCWCVGLLVVALFALSSHWGMEMAEGSQDLTTLFDGRLALNTWIFNNPNSLGHGVVALIPFSYVLMWWKRPMLTKLAALGFIAAAGYCVFLTQSKGAYLCGFAAFGIVFLFRKRLVIQAVVIAIALTSGVAAIKLLPRMNTMSAQEDGIAGRLAIWQIAHGTMVNTVTGEGWKKFEAWVTIPKVGAIRKATHGSYVNVGADLGYPGLFLFLAVLYANGRTTFLSRPPDDDLVSQRNQKALLSLVCSYAASAWMIDRAYHTDFFFIAGAVAAFHRQMTRGMSSAADEADDASMQNAPGEAAFSLSPAFGPRLALAGAEGALSGGNSPQLQVGVYQKTGHAKAPHKVADVNASALEEAEALPPVSFLNWHRIGLMDLILIYCLFEGVLHLWVEIMTNFISF